jgi:hypothetical protein
MYPFTPKSTSKVHPGQFWAIPMEDGGYACGVVLAIRTKDDGTRDSRLFLGGLLDWFGSEIPRPEDILNRPVIERGFAHIKAITENGKEVLGRLDPWWDWPAEVSHRDGIPTWGYAVISILARKHFKRRSEHVVGGNGE